MEQKGFVTKLLLGVIVLYGILNLEFLAIWTGKTFLNSNDALMGIGIRILTYIFWGGGTYLVMKKFEILGFNPMKQKETPPAKGWYIALILGIINTAYSFVDWGCVLKPIAEFQYITGQLGYGSGIVAFVMQYIYYLFETYLFFAMIVLAQKAGDIIFKNPNIPWGGIITGLTWGLNHIMTKDLICGIVSCFNAIIFGLCYLCLKRNAKYSYLFIAILFML